MVDVDVLEVVLEVVVVVVVVLELDEEVELEDELPPAEPLRQPVTVTCTRNPWVPWQPEVLVPPEVECVGAAVLVPRGTTPLAWSVEHAVGAVERAIRPAAVAPRIQICFLDKRSSLTP